jgi:PKD repeat protein
VGTVLDRSFVHTFREAGEYVATVTVIDDEGDTGSDAVTVTVGGAANVAPAVEASADVVSGPAPLRVRFGAVGDDPDGPEGGLSYAWEFGDGGSSFERRPRHTYMEPGTYTATVTATDAGGASGSDSVVITVSDPPGNRAPSVEAAVMPGAGAAPLAVRLTAAGTDPDGDRLAYAWAFGDGTADGSGRSVRHTYAAAGSYVAVVSASDGRGGSATAEVRVVVGDPPGNQAPTVQAAADPASGTAPLRVRLTSSARDADGDPLTSVWDFGDGGQAGGTSAVHTYAQPGTYDAKVTVTDPGGRTGTATVRITVTGAAGAVAGEQAAQPRVRLARTHSASRVVRRGLRYRVACEAACSVTAVLRVEKQRLGRAGARRVGAGASRTIVVRLDRRVRRNLIAAMRDAGMRRLRATLVTTVRDASGTRTLRERVVLRR